MDRKVTKTNDRDKAFKRRYTRDELLEMWGFCQHDFQRFLDLMEWLEALPDRRISGGGK